MNLQGQARRAVRLEQGYAMAALLVSLSVMAVMLTVALPVWRTAAKREREAELVWRAGQYVRAVMLFRRKYANASPPNLDMLLNERFLRRKYKDPMTKDGEFQLVYAADQQQRPGQPPATPPQPPAEPSSQLDPQGRGTAGARGGIIGVVSKSREPSLRVFNGRSKYNEWVFTPETLGIREAGPGGNVPGANVPGGPAGAVGGRPGAPGAPPGRGRIGLDPSGRPTSQPGPQQPRPFGLPPQRPPQ